MFITIITVIVPLVAFLPAVAAVQPQWAQCGGINWTGGTVCDAGLTCVYQNPYYSQCLQASSSSSSTTTTTTTTMTTAATPQPQWAQCGGINWSGTTTCASGLTCVYQNPYYSQCLLVSSSSSPAAPTTQPQWAQCGGTGWTGGTVCAPGLTCVFQNPYYSQCLLVSSTSSSTISSTTSTSTTSRTSTTSTTSTRTTTTSSTTTSSHTTTTLSTSKSSSTTTITTTTTTTSSRITTSSTSTTSSSSTSKPSGAYGPIYKSSMTHYGAGDSFGSPNCNTNTAACFFYTYPGYSAAVSQNLYGVGPGAGVGPACGTCWLLIGQTDSSGNKLSNAGTSIIVMVNNLCPAQGNPLCAQNSLSDTNQYGANVNFDLCSDSGAQAAFFGNDGVGLAVGTAQQIDCSAWTGTVVH